MKNGTKIALIIGGVVLAILLIAPFFTGYGGYGWGMMGPGMMGGFGIGGGLMFIPMILFWGLVIWGIVALVQGGWRGREADRSDHTDSALEVLKRRYARGEINKQEYEERKKDLA